MSHMPTDDQPGATTLMLENAGVPVGAGPFRTLNFTAGLSATDAGGGQADILGAGGSIPDGSVALTKLATQAPNTIVGNTGASVASPIALTAAQAKAVLAIVPADVTGLAAIASSGSAADLSAGTVAAARFADNTIIASRFAASTTRRLVGRNTAGAGAGEEVTFQQLFDWVSSANGAILTRSGGAWGALANVTSDNGDLQIATGTPVAPGSGKAKVFAQDVATRPMIAQIGPSGLPMIVQPHLGRAKTGLWMPLASTFQTLGMQIPGLTGTGTSRAATSTNLCTSMRRVGVVSAAGAGSLAVAQGSTQQFWRGNAAGLGGFTAIFRFAASDAALVATANMFVGMKATAYSTDVDPATLTNLIGVGCTNADTVMQLYAAGAVAQAKVSLGASFPVNTVSTDVYELVLYAAPNGTDVRYLLTRLNTGDTASGIISAAANLPSSTTFLLPVFARTNGGTATAVAIDVAGLSVETDY